MNPTARLFDADAEALSERVAQTIAESGAECAVSRFTYWYTARPPLHEAIIQPLVPGARAA